MRAVILAGGKGSRLLPFTVVLPKALVPVGDQPILEVLVRQLRAQGFDRITISLGHLAPLIQSYCGSGERWGARIDYLVEHQPMGTIGSLGLIEGADEDRLLVVNGDTLTDLRMDEAVSAHRSEDAMTVYAQQREVRVNFGVLESQAGYVSAYVEKPTFGYCVSMGINVISTWAIREHIARGQRRDVPELVNDLVRAGRRVRVVEPRAFWLDLGTIEGLAAGQAAFEEDPRRFLPG